MAVVWLQKQFIFYFKTQCSIMLHLSLAPAASLERCVSDFCCKEEPFPALTAITASFTLFPFLPWPLWSRLTAATGVLPRQHTVVRQQILTSSSAGTTEKHWGGQTTWDRQTSLSVPISWPWSEVWWQYRLTCDSRHIFVVYAMYPC